MVGLIYQILELVLGGGLANSVRGWMDKVWEVLQNLFNGTNGGSGIVGDGYSAFSAVGASLLILYFFMEITSKASMDLLTFEKLVVLCIKFLVAFMIMLNLKTIMNGMLDLGKGIYDLAAKGMSNTTNENSFEWYTNKHPETDEKGRCVDLMNVLEEQYSGGISEFINALSIIIPGLLGYLVMFACKFVCYFTTTKNALDICVRGWMAPIAIPQLFEDGQRSAGVRYIKGFLAATLEMTIIFLTLKLSTQFATGLQEALDGLTGAGEALFGSGYQGDINIGAIDYALSAGGLLPSLLINVVATGMVAGAGKIAHDVVGG